jgi:hypothetical protein
VDIDTSAETRSAPRWFTRELVVAGSVALAVLTVVNWSALGDPPGWDAAMSVYPAAITLSSDGFALFSQPGYAEGGANVHALSPVTLLAAGIIWLTGTVPLALLHLIQIATGALAAAVFYALIRDRTDAMVAAIGTAAAFSLPVVLAQTGALYLEVATLLAAMLAVRAWTANNIGAAAWWAAAAVWIKATGLVVPLGLALASFLVARRGLRSRFRAALPFASSLLVLVVIDRLSPSGSAEAYEFTGMVRVSIGYLLRTYDFVVITALAVAAGVLVFYRRQHEYSLGRFEAASLAIMVSSAPILIAAALTDHAYLPRYLTAVLPFGIGLIVIWLRAVGRPLAVAVSSLLIAMSIINHDGRLYRDNDIPDFALAERTTAYRSMIDLHIAAADRLSGLPTGSTVLFDHGTYYRSSFPSMGYFDDPIVDGVNLWLDPVDNLTELPDEFYMYFEYGWLGGDVVAALLTQARESSDHTVEVESFPAGDFEGHINRVVRDRGMIETVSGATVHSNGRPIDHPHWATTLSRGADASSRLLGNSSAVGVR